MPLSDRNSLAARQAQWAAWRARQPDPNATPLMSRRGEHPDLAEDGIADAWDRRYLTDADFRARVRDAVANEQNALPTSIQQLVEGRTYGEGRPPSEGLKEYSNTVKSLLSADGLMLRDDWNRLTPEQQDEYAAAGWHVHDPGNREGRIDLKLAEQWSDWSTVTEYNQAVARINEARRRQS